VDNTFYKEKLFFENIEQNYKLVPVVPLHTFLSEHRPVNITRPEIPQHGWFIIKHIFFSSS
jgi:hypothetical protein